MLQLARGFDALSCAPAAKLWDCCVWMGHDTPRARHDWRRMTFNPDSMPAELLPYIQPEQLKGVLNMLATQPQVSVPMLNRLIFSRHPARLARPRGAVHIRSNVHAL